MMTDTPLVSVGIPTYNSRDSLVVALMSVLDQGYPRLEIIVSDDCSTDDTPEVCLELSKKHKAIRYFRQQENIGLTRNFEFVMKQASGDFFMWVAHDDSLEPGILNKYVDFLTNNPDHSLVSGQIRYFSGDRCIFYERDFNIKLNSPGLRVVHYYFRVLHGALYYGLMRRETAVSIPIRNRIGDDWHFVASLAYLGKIENLDCVGYNKKLGGTSKTFRHYAETIGASWVAASFPHLHIASNAFSEILFRSRVYSDMSFVGRFILAVSSFTTVLVSYYCKVYPFVVGGRIKRLFRGLYHQGSLRPTRN